MQIDVPNDASGCPFLVHGYCVVSSKMLGCPTDTGSDEDGCAVYRVPKKCPLRTSRVVVRLRSDVKED